MKQELHSRYLADQAMFQKKSFQRIFDCIPFYVRVTSSVFHIVQHYFVATTPPLNQNGFLHFHKVGRGKK